MIEILVDIINIIFKEIMILKRKNNWSKKWER